MPSLMATQRKGATIKYPREYLYTCYMQAFMIRLTPTRLNKMCIVRSALSLHLYISQANLTVKLCTKVFRDLSF